MTHILHYAKAIRTGLLMAAKAKHEGGYRAACMLDAIARGDYSSARSHWLMVDLWVSQVDSINRITLDMCRASRMPMYGGETTRYEREEPALLPNAELASAPVVDSGTGPIPPVHTTPPVVAREPALSPPSYFPPVLRP
jgi:hypothetical protein